MKKGCQIRTHWVGVHLEESTKSYIVVLNLNVIVELVSLKSDCLQTAASCLHYVSQACT